MIVWYRIEVLLPDSYAPEGEAYWQPLGDGTGLNWRSGSPIVAREKMKDMMKGFTKRISTVLEAVNATKK